eukprot:SAG11_NODE_570_length_8454_cov_19.886655_11_plen_85_part_00
MTTPVMGGVAGLARLAVMKNVGVVAVAIAGAGAGAEVGAAEVAMVGAVGAVVGAGTGGAVVGVLKEQPTEVARRWQAQRLSGRI